MLPCTDNHLRHQLVKEYMLRYKALQLNFAFLRYSFQSNIVSPIKIESEVFKRHKVCLINRQRHLSAFAFLFLKSIIKCSIGSRSRGLRLKPLGGQLRECSFLTKLGLQQDPLSARRKAGMSNCLKLTKRGVF